MSLRVFFNSLSLSRSHLGDDLKPIFNRIGLAYFFFFFNFLFSRSSINALSEWGCCLSSRWQGIKLNIRCISLSLSFYASIYHSPSYVYMEIQFTSFICRAVSVIFFFPSSSFFLLFSFLLLLLFFWNIFGVFVCCAIFTISLCFRGWWISCD